VFLQVGYFGIHLIRQKLYIEKKTQSYTTKGQHSTTESRRGENQRRKLLAMIDCRQNSKILFTLKIRECKLIEHDPGCSDVAWSNETLLRLEQYDGPGKRRYDLWDQCIDGFELRSGHPESQVDGEK
jgi:hypothetical protein